MGRVVFLRALTSSPGCYRHAHLARLTQLINTPRQPPVSLLVNSLPPGIQPCPNPPRREDFLFPSASENPLFFSGKGEWWRDYKFWTVITPLNQFGEPFQFRLIYHVHHEIDSKASIRSDSIFPWDFRFRKYLAISYSGVRDLGGAVSR